MKIRCSSLLLIVLALAWVCPQVTCAQSGDVAAVIQKAADEYLASHFPESAGHFQVQVQRLSPDLPALDHYQVRFPAEGALPRARTQVSLYADDPNGTAQKVGWAMLYVARYDSVVVSRARISPDEVLQPDDLNIAWLETTRSYGEPLRAAVYREMLASGPVYARRLVRGGDVLRATDVRSAYAADTGSPVVVTYARGRIVLELNGTAREPGSVGDVIRIYCPDTGATYRARLTGPGAADWKSTL